MLGRLVLMTFLVSFAGCVFDPGDEATTIAYHGDQPGRDAKPFQCMDDDTYLSLTVTYKGDVGKSFSVQLQAPGGPIFFDRTFQLPGPAEQSESFSETVIAGGWTLIVERHDPFKGKIAVTANCL